MVDTAIIIAAGMGKRMGALTANKPKCMLEFFGKPLLQIHRDIFSANNIHNIVAITGYRREKVNIDNINYYHNENYQHNNILASLFCAEEALKGNVIISYADIIYSSSVIDELKKQTGDIVIVVDKNWRKTYQNRLDHPISEAESVIYDKHNYVLKIGKVINGIDANKTQVNGEFIGMLKLSSKGTEIFKETYNEANKKYNGRKFYNNQFEQAYITDLLLNIIDNNIKITAMLIDNCWREIDTIEDYENATKIARKWLTLP